MGMKLNQTEHTIVEIRVNREAFSIIYRLNRGQVLCFICLCSFNQVPCSKSLQKQILDIYFVFLEEILPPSNKGL
jgi:hypothetical protein